MQNRLKTISFFIKTGFSFAKNSLESYSGPGCLCLLHPDVWEVQTRIFGDSYRRCRNVYLPCQRHFYILFLHLIRRKKAFFQMVPFGAIAVFVSCKHKQHITRHINKSTSKKHDRYSIKTQQMSLANPATAAPPTEVPYPAESSSAGKETSRYPSLLFL